jgi:hypothetical protein
MPAEFRFLVFSTDEATTALADHARKNNRLPADGKPVSSEPVGEKVINGRLLVDIGGRTPSVAPFTQAQVLEALIDYCLKRRIPMPMVSEKTLERIHGRFALRIGHVDSIDFQIRTAAPRRD